eukprot:4188507-Pyramimonas_sp.AAC.1
MPLDIRPAAQRARWGHFSSGATDPPLPHAPPSPVLAQRGLLQQGNADRTHRPTQTKAIGGRTTVAADTTLG